MQLSVFLFPSYVGPYLFADVCPLLWQAMTRHRTLRIDFVRWDGYLQSLPNDRRVVIFSSYSNDLRPLPLRQYCDQRGHLLVENELVTDVYGEIVGDTVVDRFDEFLSAINPRMRKPELASTHPPSPVA